MQKPPTPPRHLTPQERARLLRWLAQNYERGATIRSLATRTGYSFGTTRSFLLEAGVTLRPSVQVVPSPEGCPINNHLLAVLRQIANGASTAEGAANLGMSPNTFKAYAWQVSCHLGAHSRPHAVALAMVAGWITVSDIDQHPGRGRNR